MSDQPPDEESAKQRVWGFMDGDTFIPLPRWAGFDGEPPCDITLPDGRIRRLIWSPDGW